MDGFLPFLFSCPSPAVQQIIRMAGRHFLKEKVDVLGVTMPIVSLKKNVTWFSVFGCFTNS